MLGRVLWAGEIYRMALADNIVNWYAQREAGENFASWAMANREKADALARAELNWMERNPEDG